jgi:hypothetical protein
MKFHTGMEFFGSSTSSIRQRYRLPEESLIFVAKIEYEEVVLESGIAKYPKGDGAKVSV